MNEPLHLRMHTTVLRVSNLERSISWYTEKLGMNVIYRDIHYRLVMVRDSGESQLSLWELRPGEEPTTASKSTVYPVFISTDALADHHSLAERGVDPDPVEDYPHGLRMFWITDPDGHRLCVIEFLPE